MGRGSETLFPFFKGRLNIKNLLATFVEIPTAIALR